MNEWMTDRPTETGQYLVTLETTFDDGKPHRWVENRFFAYPNTFLKWTMDGEDAAQMHWTVEAASLPYERVIAWMPFPDKLPLPEPYES